MEQNPTRIAEDSGQQQVPWLPGERLELALDARKGIVASAGGSDVLTVTNHRAIKVGRQAGKRTTMLVPLDQLTGIEVIDAFRPPERLLQGLFWLGIGVVLGWLSWWVVPGNMLPPLIVGGIPVLASVYMLAGYAFPDSEGELVLYAGGISVHQPLLSRDARNDANLVGQRLYELMALGRRGASMAVALPPEPVAESAPTAPPDPAPSAIFAPRWAPPSTVPAEPGYSGAHGNGDAPAPVTSPAEPPTNEAEHRTETEPTTPSGA